jgi:hypothetical protein
MLRLKLLILILLSCAYVQAQKSTITSVGARLVTDINEQTQTDDMGLAVTLRIEGVQYANTVSIGVGTLSLTADGISTIFEVVKDNRAFYVVEQNIRAKVENGMVTVFVHLVGNLTDYKGKYAIVSVTDKEGHVSPIQSVQIE